MRYPLASITVTSPFGPRKPPNAKAMSNHLGVDLRASIGTNVYAPAAGTVTYVGTQAARGLYVKIDHGAGISTIVQHLSSAAVKKGDKVSEGQVIAKTGASGNVTGPHLHFEVQINGVPVDPMVYVPQHPDTPAPAPAAPTAEHVESVNDVHVLGSRTLVFGSKGTDVKELQHILNAWYPQLPRLVEDGDYGALTENRVKFLQNAAGITVDGKAGSQTFGVLHVKTS